MSELVIFMLTFLTSLTVLVGVVFAAGIGSSTPWVVTRRILCPVEQRHLTVRFLSDSLNRRDYDDVAWCSRFPDGRFGCARTCRVGGKLNLDLDARETLREAHT